MPESPWVQDVGAARNLSSSISRAMLGRQQMRFNQQQLIMQEMLRQAQMQHMAEQDRRLQQQTEAERRQQQLAQQVGRARTYGSALLSPAVGRDPGVLTGAVNLAREQGVAPEGAFDISREDLVDLLNALAKSMTEEQAVSTPSSAASMMAPHNIPEGDVAVDRFGNPMGVGAPRSTMPFTYEPGRAGSPYGVFNRETGQFAPAGTNAPPASSMTREPNMVAMWNEAIRGLTSSSRPDPAIEGMLQNVATNLAPVLLQSMRGGRTNVPTAQPQASKRPTRKMAADYITNYGSREAAIAHLKADGYDVTGYAD